MSDPIQIKTTNAINADLLAALATEQGITDEEIGAVDRTFTYAVAEEIDEAYFQLLRADRGRFIGTATGQALANRMADEGLSKRAATSSKTTLRFTTTGAASVSPGDIFSVEATTGTDQIDFQVTQAASIGGAGTFDTGAEAVVAGSHASQLPSGSITKLTTNIANISAVTNPASTSVSFDEETDDAARARLRAHLNAKSRGTLDAILSAALNFSIQQTRLSRSMTNSQNYAEVEDVSTLPFSSVGTGKLSIRDTVGGPISEVVSYTDINEALDPQRFTGLTRAQESTTAAAHEVGAIVEEWVGGDSYGRWPTSAAIEEGSASVTVTIDDSTNVNGAHADLVTVLEKRLRGDVSNYTRDPGHKAGGISLTVQNRTTVSVTFAYVIAVSPGYTLSEVGPRVQSAVESACNNLPVGYDVYADQALCWALDVLGVERVVTTTINGTTYQGTNAANVAIAATEVARTTIASISVTS